MAPGPHTLIVKRLVEQIRVSSRHCVHISDNTFACLTITTIGCGRRRRRSRRPITRIRIGYLTLSQFGQTPRQCGTRVRLAAF